MKSEGADRTMRIADIEIRYHDFGADADKLAAITASMRESGYMGAPIVVLTDGESVMGITGQHRTLAAREAGLDEVPVIDIREVFAQDDQDFDVLWEQAGYPTPSEMDFERLLRELDSSVADAYGIES